MDFATIWSTISAPPIPAIIVASVAVIFIAYIYIVKAIRSGKKDEEPSKAPEKKESLGAAVSNKPAGAAASAGDLELVGTDEKTAAVIMAIVSDKSGIPLNRLQFKSITLMEDK